MDAVKCMSSEREGSFTKLADMIHQLHHRCTQSGHNFKASLIKTGKKTVLVWTVEDGEPASRK